MRATTMMVAAVLIASAGCDVPAPPRKDVSQPRDDSKPNRKSEQPRKEPKRQVPEKIERGPDSLIKLFSEFTDNPVAADRKYVGKLLRLPDPLPYPSAKVVKRDGGYWIMVPVGVSSLHDQSPVYGVECRLSKRGEDQYAAGAVKGVEMVGRVKGTRPYRENVFGEVMLTIEDCYFVPTGQPKK